MRVRAFVLGSSMTLAGCGPTATFVCSSDAECRDGDRVGTCEADRFCSFPDDACPSRRRYGERAPASIAGECVVDDPLADTGIASTGGQGSTGSAGETTDAVATTESAPAESSAAATSRGDDTSTVPAAWWDTGWSHRVEITVAYDGETDGLVDVPLLAVLAPDRFDASVASAQGTDLRFVTADGTELPHEIDTWSADAAPLVWFRMPAITGTDTLWLYYGNPDASDAGATGVWSSDHIAVFHMGATIDDASGSLGPMAQPSVAGPGVLGDATVFDEKGGAAELGDLEALRELFFAGASFSAWIRPTSWGVGGNWARIFDKMDLPSDGAGYSVMLEAAGRFRFVQGFAPGESGWETAGGVIALGEWAYVSLSYRAVDTSTPPVMYVDGVARTLTQNFVDDGDPLGDAGVSAAIGGRMGLEPRTFEGRIDELRIEAVERPPQWHELQYLSMTDAVLQWGSTELQP